MADLLAETLKSGFPQDTRRNTPKKQDDKCITGADSEEDLRGSKRIVSRVFFTWNLSI